MTRIAFGVRLLIFMLSTAFCVACSPSTPVTRRAAHTWGGTSPRFIVASSSSASVALASAVSWASSLTKPKSNPLYLSASQV